MGLNRVKVTDVRTKLSTEIETGKSLLESSYNSSIELIGDCNGKGACGKCKVKVMRGNDYALTPLEKELLSFTEIKGGYRLACKFYPKSDLLIETMETKEGKTKKSRIITIPYFLKDEILEENHGKMWEYGIAFDIGTTTILGMLWHLESGENICNITKSNPQSIYGSDVISRIVFAEESPDNFKELNAKTVNCLNEIIDEFIQVIEETEDTAHEINCRNFIKEVSVVGNTAMSHIFMGLDLSGLATSPFAPAFERGQTKVANELGLNLGACPVKVMSNIGGHVGSDITAGIVAEGICHGEYKNQTTLLIDIGTNGEIALSSGGKLAVCSTAAGPAFEGAAISKGMRALRGAIDEVYIKGDDIAISVIGGDDVEPIGICGSGIIDCIAVLVEGEIIDSTGKLKSREELELEGFSEKICARAKVSSGERQFRLSSTEEKDKEIVITQKDIREIQNAKAAIFAGVLCLLHNYQISISHIDKVLIAGTFGNYLKDTSLLSVGILPKVKKEIISFVGNSAGVGASLALLSKKISEKAEECAGKAEHIELASYTGFQDIYIKSMNF